jgi:GYF domain 2
VTGAEVKIEVAVYLAEEGSSQRRKNRGHDMAAAWYYDDLGSEQGPFTAVELRRLVRDGDVRPGTLVRKESDGRWVLASKVRGLLDGAVTGPNGGGEERPITDVTLHDPFGIQTASLPAEAGETDEDDAATQEVTPPPLPSVALNPGAPPLDEPKAFIKSIRSHTYYPFLRTLIRLLACAFLWNGAILVICLICAGALAVVRGDVIGAFLVLGAAGVGIIWFFIYSVFYEWSSLVIDVADVLIEQARRSRKE